MDAISSIMITPSMHAMTTSALGIILVYSAEAASRMNESTAALKASAFS